MHFVLLFEDPLLARGNVQLSDLIAKSELKKF
jgi:hypothetical protein